MTPPAPTTSGLPRSMPSVQRVDAAGVDAFLDAVETRDDLELHSLMLLRHGQVVAEGWWAPYAPADAPLLYSLSKSFTATALGFAVDEGRLSLDDRVVSFFPDFPERRSGRAELGPRTRTLAIRDLAAMATGHHEDTVERAARLSPADPALGFLGLEPESEPGSRFTYNNGATYTLAAILQRLTGESLTDYLRSRLFDPLGIDRAYWDQQPPGRDLGFTGLHLSTEAIARFGQLYLDDGVWQGRRLLPAGWVGEATRLHTPNPAEPNPDWRQGYGLQFWRSRHGGYRGDGAYGQFCVVLPEQDVVLVTTAATGNMQGILDAAWTHLLPALDRPGSAAADLRLSARLSELELRTDRDDPEVEQPSNMIEVVDLSTDPDRPGWRLSLREAGHRLDLSVGDGSWARSEVPVGHGRLLRVAARGSESDGCVVADLVLVESPHRLRITVDPGREARVVWHTSPLFAPALAELATASGLT